MAWDLKVVDGCVVVTMNTNKVNMQNEEFFAHLHQAFDRLETEFAELPVVLTGQGDVFSAGIDFQYSFEIFGSGDEALIRDWYARYQRVWLRLFTYPRPTVAAINGHAIAGGLATALNCDFRVAARKPARFGLNEVAIGIPMFAGYCEILKYALGDRVASLVALRAKIYDFKEAEGLGFFHEVVEPEQLLGTAISYAKCISPDANEAYAMSKRGLQDSVLRHMHERAPAIDEMLSAVIGSPGSRRAQDRRRSEIMERRRAQSAA